MNYEYVNCYLSSGLIPRILFEASSIALTSVIVYFAKNYIADMKEIDGFVDLVASILSNTITYPLSVISTVRAKLSYKIFNSIKFYFKLKN